VARPLRSVILRGDERWSPTAPPCVVFLWWRVRGSLREVRIRWSHSVRWRVVLQRHYDGGSRTTVAFSVWCSLLLSVFLSMQSHAAVSVLVGAVSGGEVLLFMVHVDVLILPSRFVLWSCIVRLASMSQSDQPVQFALVSFRRALMPQSNPQVLFFRVFSFITWLCPRNTFLYFLTILRETHWSTRRVFCKCNPPASALSFSCLLPSQAPLRTRAAWAPPTQYGYFPPLLFSYITVNYLLPYSRAARLPPHPLSTT
jgi:hypothetical protein